MSATDTSDVAPDGPGQGERPAQDLLGRGAVELILGGDGGGAPHRSGHRAATAAERIHGGIVGGLELLGVADRPRRQHLAVAVVRGQQLLVGARRRHPPAVEQDDPVGQGDGGRPVGDDDRGPIGPSRWRARPGSRAPSRGRRRRWRRRAPGPEGRRGSPGRWRCAAADHRTARTPARPAACRSPPGSSSMNSVAPASAAARSMRAGGASGSAKAMLAATVSWKRNVSSKTMPTLRRRSWSRSRRTSTPSSSMAPSSTS